jgi:arylsulfatase A-like enzyme
VREGVEFPRAYVSNPASGPSRAALQTGRYPHAVSVPWSGQPLPLGHPCLADAFAAAGYRTGYIGKWELDGSEDPGFTPPGPRRRGYEYWGAPRTARGFELDHQTDLAVEFIGKQPVSPFLLVVSYGPPHGPYTVPPQQAVEVRENVPAEFAKEARAAVAGYLAMCSAVDEAMGRLLGALDTRGLARETIVVFTSDHGVMLRSHGLEGQESWFEESVGVPLVMRWPEKLGAGTKQDWLLNNIDIAPTLRGMCGLEGLEAAQGEDRWELIRNGGTGERPESAYGEGELGTPREWRMVVRGWDKLVVDRELKATHLYNLAQDPYENENLLENRGTIRRQEELLALLRRWIVKAGDRVPYPGRR